MSTKNRSCEQGGLSEKQAGTPSQAPNLSKVIADFGGRRKIFDRRVRQIPITHAERRSGCDRRSGFDRRSAIGQNGDSALERRKNNFPPPSGPDADTST
jgi:hypothetical protein